MDWVGVAALIAACVGGIGVAILPRQSSLRVAFMAVSVGSWWAALCLLAWRFVNVDLRLVEVGRYTRDELSWPLRLAGTWAGANGSILLWFTLVITAVAVLAPQGRRWLGAVSAVGAVVVAVWARPFALVSEPPLYGAGLNPVLEHWAMNVHPPLLYVAQALVIATAWRSFNGPTRQPEDEPQQPIDSRALALVSVSVLVCATMLGAWWAHDELGWGGWWAWDPVENTALAPLAAMIASLHVTSRVWRERWRWIAATSVLAGIAVTRSGLPSSVHAFSAGGVIAAVFAVAALVGGVLASLVRPTVADVSGSDAEVPTTRRWSDSKSAAATVVSAVVTWVLVVIASAAVASLWLGTRDPAGAIDGALLAKVLVPAGVLLVVALIAYGIRRGMARPALLAHVGVLVFAVGVIGTVGERQDVTNAQVGETVQLDGRQVHLESVNIDDSRSDITRADVALTVDGRSTVASIIEYPDLDRTRARPGRLLDWSGETEVTVTMLDSDGALVVLSRHPALPYVWLGAAIIVVAMLPAAATRRGQRSEELPGSESRRRARLAASSESSEEPPEAVSPGAVVGGAAGAAGGRGGGGVGDGDDVADGVPLAADAPTGA